jgi:lipopolysaccharide/colanic/teichoic acid biosynthesis glycosyltransferase
MVMRQLIEQLHNQPIHSTAIGSYHLKWRQKNLVIRQAPSPDHPLAITVQDINWVTARIVRSPVKRINLDRNFTLAELEFWAQACADSGKPVYLSIPSTASLPNKRKPWRWRTKWLVDRLAAVMILAVLSPILLGLSAWIYCHTADASLLVGDWQIGERGRLYRALYFRTQVDGRPIDGSRIIRRYRLDRLPKLINVLRGEMSLVGGCPRRLCDVVGVSHGLHTQFNTLPGITGTWHLEKCLDAADRVTLQRLDRNYIRNWSLRRDFKVLLLSTAKIWIAEQF